MFILAIQIIYYVQTRARLYWCNPRTPPREIAVEFCLGRCTLCFREISHDPFCLLPLLRVPGLRFIKQTMNWKIPLQTMINSELWLCTERTNFFLTSGPAGWTAGACPTSCSSSTTRGTPFIPRRPTNNSSSRVRWLLSYQFFCYRLLLRQSWRCSLEEQSPDLSFWAVLFCDVCVCVCVQCLKWRNPCCQLCVRRSTPTPKHAMRPFLRLLFTAVCPQTPPSCPLTDFMLRWKCPQILKSSSMVLCSEHWSPSR